MSEGIIMESQRYMDAQRVVCFACDASSLASTERCCKCQMPLAVSRSVGSRGVAPDFIPFLGGSGVGKTVYIATLLHMLSRGYRNISGAVNDEQSSSHQQQIMNAIKRRRFPGQTGVEPESWNWVQCGLEFKNQKDTRSFDWVAPDVSGESWMMELAHPGAFPALTVCVAKATGLILMVDALKAAAPSTSEDLFSTQLAAYVGSYARRGGEERLVVDIPIAITFTKTDLCKEAALDPEGFARRNLPGFFAYVQHNMPKHGFFATSAVGGVTRVADRHGGYFLPMHVQPKGVVEPLAWLLTR